MKPTKEDMITFFNVGDKYFNKENRLVYTCLSANSSGECLFEFGLSKTKTEWSYKDFAKDISSVFIDIKKKTLSDLEESYNLF